MTVLTKILNGSTGLDSRDTINSMLPQGKLTAAPVAVVTPSNLSALMQSTAMVANVTFPYVDTAVTNGTTYYYTATATNAVSEGPQSVEKTAIPGVSAKPGPGLLVSDDVGQGVATAVGAVPAAGWSNTSFTYSPATSTVTAHNTVAGPDGTTLDASTIRLNSPSSSSGFPSVECATTANTGNIAVTASVYLRGKVGGEVLQLKMFGTVTNGSNNHTPDVGAAQITLTTSWVKYSVSGTVPASSKAIFQIGIPNLVEDASFDAAWANLVAS
ncbi:hypothetical protein [Sphingomonas sp. PAMC 26617]|uniref:hypothetical protein n=1 Tax=Sphingomonas sp. PAMC 26617 TaxID=1112216 RepID=UPI0012F4DA41|nr:hypothetical protein [Sphingomonas sp. PAMC 26617]